MFVRWNVVVQKLILGTTTFCLTAGLPDAQAQHSMPVPACPGRGLVAPGSQGLWHLDGCYGCGPDHSSTGDEAVPFDHILPEFLHEYRGISAEYIYTSEVFSIAHGGFNTNRGTRYRGNLDLVLTGDTEAMELWKGGRFFVYGNAYHGQTLTENFVGDAQAYSNIFADATAEIRRRSAGNVSRWFLVPHE